MIGRGHAATQLASEIRITVGIGLDGSFLLAQQVGADGGAGAESLEVEGLIVFAATLGGLLVPEAVGIVAVERNHLAKGHGSLQLRPSGAGVERQVEAALQSQRLQGHEILAPAAVLVVELGGDDRTTVLPLQALHLGEDLAIELSDIVEKHIVLLAQPAALGEHPVGDAAIAHLAMTERPEAEHHGHALVAAYLEEAAQVALSVPPVDALLLLDVVPEDVGGDDRHTSLAHLAHLGRPFGGRHTAVVYLAHDRTDAVAVDEQTMTVPGDRLAEVGRLGSHAHKKQGEDDEKSVVGFHVFKFLVNHRK